MSSGRYHYNFELSHYYITLLSHIRLMLHIHYVISTTGEDGLHLAWSSVLPIRPIIHQEQCLQLSIEEIDRLLKG